VATIGSVCVEGAEGGEERKELELDYIKKNKKNK
jgi:hypothetical protein